MITYPREPIRPLPPLAIPACILRALWLGAALAVNVSAGKDSQALALMLAAWWLSMGFPGAIFVVHANLGRADWPETPGHARQIAAWCDLPFAEVERTGGDLVARIEQRAERVGPGVPFWPTKAQRYCTSDNKRGPLNTHMRGYPLIISAEGMRAEEGDDRKRKPIVEMRHEITGKAYHEHESDLDAALDAYEAGETPGRLAFTWLPLHAWPEASVYHASGATIGERNRRRELYAAGHVAEALDGWPMHPAYVYGNDRMGCAICFLASMADKRNGARHKPDLVEIYRGLEQRTGMTYRKGTSITELLAE